MVHQITSHKLRLPYPLFCAEFLDDDHLLVGGGGGESRSGVGNGLMIIDLSKGIETKASVDLSKSEDAVMSMALVPNTSKLIAGVNQNEKLVKDTNKNEHVRTFTVTPKKITVAASMQQFEPLEWDEIYQRTTVCSPSGKYAAIVASMPKTLKAGAAAGEIVILKLEEGKIAKKVVATKTETEIVDADIIPSDANKENDEADGDADEEDEDAGVEYIVYATARTFFHRTFIPDQKTHKITKFDVQRFTVQGDLIRAVRYLTPGLVLVLLNLVERKGAELLVISLQPREHTFIVDRRQLHNGVKAATTMDLVHLKPSGRTTDQVVVAVGGADLSIELVVLDIKGEESVSMRSFQVLKDIHDFPASKVSFAKQGKNARSIKLASVSAANTVVVHKIPLADPSHLKRKGNMTATVLISVFSLVFIVLLAVALQLVFEYRGDLPKAGERIAHVWEEVVDSVVGTAKLGQGGKYERVTDQVEDLVKSVRGVETGVGGGLDKENAEGIVEGFVGAVGG